MPDSPKEGAEQLTPNEALRPRAPDLYDLLDLLVALRLGLCLNGDPTRPVSTLAPEAIYELCDMANRAIASTKRLVELIENDASQPRTFSR